MTENINIPKHWQLVRVGEYVISVKGKKPKEISPVKTHEFSIPYVNIKAFEKNVIDEFTDGVGCVLCEEGDFLMVWDGSRSGYVGKAIKGALGSTLVKLKFPDIDTNYAYYFLQSKYIEINTKAKGVGIPHVDPNILWNYNLPIPPLPEQKAIVSKIEELLSDLENGKNQLQTAQQQLKVYRQSLLKWAFEGKLTTVRAGRDMSKKDGELPEGWKWVKLEDIASVGTGATPLKGQGKFYEGGNIPWITSGALNEEYVTEAKDYVTETALSETNLTVYPKNTLLLAMYGEGKTRGKCSELLMEACTNQAIASIHNLHKERIIKNYLKLFLQKNYNDIRMLSSGGVQPNLNLGIVKKTLIPLPTIEEQQHIIDESESKLTVCNKIEQIINQSLQQAETLRQSILKKAFEGRLILKT